MIPARGLAPRAFIFVRKPEAGLPKQQEKTRSFLAGRWSSFVLAAMAFLAVGYLVFAANSAPPKAAIAEQRVSAHVKIVLPNGSGSGVHIGSGYILTAAHVVGPLASVSIKASDGSSSMADVLWANHAYDIALIRLERHSRFDAVPLGCDVPSVGEHFTAHGNPMDAEFISTEGRFVGAPVRIADWREVMYVDATIVPGMSGGGVVDDSGSVAGIIAGVMVVPNATVYAPMSLSMVGIGIVVPSSTACKLMGRF